MKQLQRKQMCTVRIHDAQVFGNGNNSHTRNVFTRILQTPRPYTLNSFACTNIFYILFDSSLEIISYFIPECFRVSVCAYAFAYLELHISLANWQEEWTMCECVWVYFAATLIRARLKCAYEILTTGKKWYNMAVSESGVKISRCQMHLRKRIAHVKLIMYLLYIQKKRAVHGRAGDVHTQTMWFVWIMCIRVHIEQCSPFKLIQF